MPLIWPPWLGSWPMLCIACSDSISITWCRWPHIIRELDRAALHVTYIPVVELQYEETHNHMTAQVIDSFSPVWELEWFKRILHSTLTVITWPEVPKYRAELPIGWRNAMRFGRRTHVFRRNLLSPTSYQKSNWRRILAQNWVWRRGDTNNGRRHFSQQFLCWAKPPRAIMFHSSGKLHYWQVSVSTITTGNCQLTSLNFTVKL
jgi:hypothetical protein